MFSRLKCFIIYFLACSESRKSQLQRYGDGNKGGAGYQIERNMSFSEAVDPSSNLVSNLEECSESSYDDFLASGNCSKGCDIGFRVRPHQGNLKNPGR